MFVSSNEMFGPIIKTKVYNSIKSYPHYCADDLSHNRNHVKPTSIHFNVVYIIRVIISKFYVITSKFSQKLINCNVFLLTGSGDQRTLSHKLWWFS